MLMENGTFKGSLNDICDRLSLQKTSKNRAKIKTILLQEEQDGLIYNFGLSDSTTPSELFELSIVPKEETIEIDTNWLDLEKLKGISYSRSVSYEVLLKVLLWIIDNNRQNRLEGLDTVFTGKDASKELNIDSSTFTDARKVLEQDFNIFDTTLIYEEKRHGEDFKRCVGQRATEGAFNNFTSK